MCQVFATIFLIALAHCVGLVKLPTGLSQATIFNKVFPLPMLYVLNLACGW